MNCLNKKSIFQLLQDENSETDISELLRVMLYSVTVYFFLLKKDIFILNSAIQLRILGLYAFVMNVVYKGI